MALGSGSIDAASFTSIRLLSGAITLVLLAGVGRERATPWFTGGWISPVLLAAYATTFSFAYLSLSTGTGALVMFFSVQITIILWTLAKGERPSLLEWAGLAIALGGLIYLVSPGVEAPSLVGALLMTAAGVSWGFYTVRGRGGTNPLAATTGNFILAVPLVLLISLLTVPSADFSSSGVGLAVLSGALASGCGYVVWYSALRHLSSTHSAVVQLSVPVLAAIGGVALLDEEPTLRLVLSSALILGGIGLAIAGHSAAKAPVSDR